MRRVPWYRVGDDSGSVDFGVSVDGGGVSWDPSKLTVDLPPSVSGNLNAGLSAIKNGDEATAYKSMLMAWAGAVAIAGFPYGTVAAAVVALIEGLGSAGAGGGCCADHSCGPASFAGFAPWSPSNAGPAGSFQQFANLACFANFESMWDACTNDCNNCTSSSGYAAGMASALATAIAHWNATHASSRKLVYQVPHTNHGQSGGSGFQTPNGMAGGTDPIAVAVNWIALHSGAPSDITFSFEVNAGEYAPLVVTNPLELSAVAQRTSVGPVEFARFNIAAIGATLAPSSSTPTPAAPSAAALGYMGSIFAWKGGAWSFVYGGTDPAAFARAVASTTSRSKGLGTRALVSVKLPGGKWLSLVEAPTP